MTMEHRDELQVPRGTVLFRQGDPGHEMFVIATGRIRLSIGEPGYEREIGDLGPGEFFGELALLSDVSRTATAVAVEDSTLLVIGRDAFAMMVQDDLDIVFRMMHTQGRRLQRTDQPIRDLTREMGRLRVMLQCLRQLAAADFRFPASIELTKVASDLGLNRTAVQEEVAALVSRGVGLLEDGRWAIESRQQLEQLLDALCGMTEDAAGG
jgi:CRP/FNR family cyclic AMP-dependent transcriptional regulator